MHGPSVMQICCAVAIKAAVMLACAVSIVAVQPVGALA
jgi:hypothetical protein